MAKDLPYFKFFCSEWNDGDITLENFEYQGLFINICSYYWSNECSITFDKLLKKFRGFDEILLDLNAAGLFKIDDNRNISISFLDEQRNERIESSKNKSKGGKASAEARRLKKLAVEKQQEINKHSTEKEHLLNSCSTEVQVLRREEKREEEKRKENNYRDVDFLKDFNELRVSMNRSKVSNINSIRDYTAKAEFKELVKSYVREDFIKAIKALFKQQQVPNGNTVMFSDPKHLILHFSRYLDAFENKNDTLYGEKPKTPTL